MDRNGERTTEEGTKPKRPRFDYELMRQAALDPVPATRKDAFIEYFERFSEFPSYLFDLEPVIDERLLVTIDDIRSDPATARAVLEGIDALVARLKI